jgi:hypothetical protein
VGELKLHVAEIGSGIPHPSLKPSFVLWFKLSAI